MCQILLELSSENHLTISKNNMNAMLSNGNASLATNFINFIKASYFPAAFKLSKTFGNNSSTSSASSSFPLLSFDFIIFFVVSNSDCLAEGFTGLSFSLFLSSSLELAPGE